MMGPLAVWKMVSSPVGRSVVLVIALWAGLLWFGNRKYDKGYAAAVADNQAVIEKIQIEVDQATQITRRQASELEAYREAARMLAMETDNEILADGNACVPTPDELRRAKRRWGSSD